MSRPKYRVVRTESGRYMPQKRWLFWWIDFFLSSCNNIEDAEYFIEQDKIVKKKEVIKYY